MKESVKLTRGFTIVELLIVIVIIAILSAITIVAYNGIQARAKTTSIVSSAGQMQQLLLAYKATYGTYPPQLATNGKSCLTMDNSCTMWDGTPVTTTDNSTLMTELRKIGNPPQSIPHLGSSFYGLYFDYYQPRTFNHDAVPGLLMYWLPPNQSCQLGSVAVGATYAGEPSAFQSSTTGYTSSDSTRVSCWLSV